MRPKLSPWARQFSGGYDRDAVSLERSLEELEGAIHWMTSVLQQSQTLLENGKSSTLRDVKDAVVAAQNRLSEAITHAKLVQNTSPLRKLPSYYGPEHLYSQAHTKLSEHAGLLTRATALRSAASRATIGSLDEVRAAIAKALGEKVPEITRAVREGGSILNPEQRATATAVLQRYGARLTDDGFIARGDKVLSVRLEIQKGRLRMIGGGNLLASYPASRMDTGIANFVEKFWFWTPEAVRAIRESHCSTDADGVRRVLQDAKKQGAYGVAPGTASGTPWVALRHGPGQAREEAPVLCQRDGRFTLGAWRRSTRAHAVVKSLESARTTKGAAWGIWDIQRGKWMPDPLKMPVDPSPARYASRGDAEKAADRNWRRHNPNDLFVVRGFEGARQTRERSRSLNYGELPSREVFERAFERELGNRKYLLKLRGDDARMARRCGLDIGHRTGPRQGSTLYAQYPLDQEELYQLLQCLTRGWGQWSARADAEAAGDLASGILTTLGFEWV